MDLKRVANTNFLFKMQRVRRAVYALFGPEPRFPMLWWWIIFIRKIVRLNFLVERLPHLLWFNCRRGICLPQTGFLWIEILGRRFLVLVGFLSPKTEGKIGNTSVIFCLRLTVACLFIKKRFIFWHLAEIIPTW